ISFEVYNELLRAKEAGYDFVDDLLEQGFGIVYLDSELIKEYEAWNCAHLANGEVIKKLVKINESSGIHTPIICTPEELMGV
ncbi:MAG: hypothetical protein U9N12_08615, partial [Euryarchaeota archaeon]|nr:hypothetical protein [Euryarchaeota archaeon]